MDLGSFSGDDDGRPDVSGGMVSERLLAGARNRGLRQDARAGRLGDRSYQEQGGREMMMKNRGLHP